MSQTDDTSQIGQMSAGEIRRLSIHDIYDTQKNDRQLFPLLVIGKPFHNKPCDKYQRHRFNLCVKRYKIPFLKNDFRNIRKATLASYKASILLLYWGGLCLYSAFLPTAFHLWCHNGTTNPENTCQLLWKWCCANAAPESHSRMS